MSVGEIVCRSARQALDALESLIGEGRDYVFRGHDEPGWRLAWMARLNWLSLKL